MWIDFPPNPSIITGISWKPTSRRRLRALGSSDRSGVSPSHSKYLFFFWRGGSPAVRAFHVSVPPLSFRDDFKAHFGSFVLPDVTAGPQKCPNRKMWCRSNYSGCVSEEKWSSSTENIQSLGTEQRQLLCFLSCLSVQGRLEKWEKKGHSCKGLAENRCLSFLCWLFFFFFMKLFSGTICQMARSLSYTFDLTGDFIRVLFEVIQSPCACSLTPVIA